jgi:hypothetical protein
MTLNDFLCERYSLSHWITDVDNKYRPRNRIEKIVIVASTDSGLDTPLAEYEWIKKEVQNS